MIVQLTSSRFFGGPERQMLELARALRPAEETAFLSFSEGGLCRSFLDRVRRDGFAADELAHDTPWLRAALRELTDRLAKISPRVVCCHGYKANLLGLLAARRLELPVVAVSRGWTGETWKVRLYEVLDRRVLRRMDRVVCVSAGQAAAVRRAGVPEDRTRIIHNAIRTARFEAPSSGATPSLLSLAPDGHGPIVMSAGRLSPEKGFDVLIAAVGDVLRDRADARFIILGDGRLREPLQTQIDKAGLREQVRLAGFRDDLDELLPQCDVFVLPSFTEGLPNVVLEAFAAGVPVVATAVGGTPEVVADGESGFLVPPGRPAELARRIVELLTNERLGRRFAARGRQRVADDFSFAAQAEKYRRVFDELAAGPAPTSTIQLPREPAVAANGESA